MVKKLLICLVRFKDGDNWRYILKNGYYAQNGWLQDPATQKYYYFNMAAIMEADTTTPDGYYVGADGAWDGNASTKNTTEEKNLGPGVDKGWEPVDTGWKFKQEDGPTLPIPGDRTATVSGIT